MSRPQAISRLPSLSCCCISLQLARLPGTGAMCVEAKQGQQNKHCGKALTGTGSGSEEQESQMLMLAGEKDSPGKIQKLLHWLIFTVLPFTFTGFSGDPARTW